MAKEQMTMEEYLLSQMETPVKLNLSKQAQKVKMVATDTAIPNDDEPAQGGNSGGNNGGNQQGGGSQDTGGGLEP